MSNYIYNGDNLLEEYDAGGGRLTARYLYSGAVDDILMMSRDVNTDGQLTADEDFFYYKNHLGSVTNILTRGGEEVKRYKYEPFGSLLSEWTSTGSPGFDNSIMFTGREYDRESSLYFFRARYYDTASGRFLQEDPKWDLNLYTYAGNNSISNTDAYGKWIEDNTKSKYGDMYEDAIRLIQSTEIGRYVYSVAFSSSRIAHVHIQDRAPLLMPLLRASIQPSSWFDRVGSIIKVKHWRIDIVLEGRGQKIPLYKDPKTGEGSKITPADLSELQYVAVVLFHELVHFNGAFGDKFDENGYLDRAMDVFISQLGLK